HFFTEPVRPGDEVSFVIPKGSLLDRWRSAAKDDKVVLAEGIQRLLTEGPAAAVAKADAVLYSRLASLNGPLFGRLRERPPKGNPRLRPGPANANNDGGLDPGLFGRHPRGASQVDPSSLCVKAPAVVEVRVPADLVAGYELATTGILSADAQEEGSVQLQV